MQQQNYQNGNYFSKRLPTTAHRPPVPTPCVRVQNTFVLCPGASRLGPDVLCQSTKPICTQSRSVAARSRRLVSEYKTLLYSAAKRRGSVRTSCVRVQNPFVLRQESLRPDTTPIPDLFRPLSVVAFPAFVALAKEVAKSEPITTCPRKCPTLGVRIRS